MGGLGPDIKWWWGHIQAAVVHREIQKGKQHKWGRTKNIPKAKSESAKQERYLHTFGGEIVGKLSPEVDESPHQE